MDLLSPSIAQSVLQKARDRGADFADIFVEKVENNVISIKSSKVQGIQSGILYGIGVRLIYGDYYLYAYSNDNSEKSLMELVNNLADAHQGGAKNQTIQTKSSSAQLKEVGFYSTPEVSVDTQIAYLMKVDSKIRAKSQLIQQVSVDSMLKKQWVQIFNTEGLVRSEMRPYVRLFHSAIAKDGPFQTSSFYGPGARGGYGFIEKQDPEFAAEEVASTVLTMLKADPCPAGKMPVVINNGFGGVIFHEACGHILETTSVQKKASVLWDKMGQKVAHEAVSAVDDGTNDFLWGSLSIDDEGMPTQKTQLIKNGMLNSFLVDRVGAIKTGFAPTGSGRKQNYKFAPASRMRNTYIEPGKFSLDELIGGIDYGIFAKKMGGGSVNPSTGEFNFSVEEGYIVKNGKIEKPVRGATLIGKGEEILKEISMVGKDLEFAAGMCGSVSGSIPTTVGQPPLKVDNILVGGKGV